MPKISSYQLNSSPQPGDYIIGDTVPITSNSTYKTTIADLLSGTAPLNSPAFTGVPTAPTAPLGTNTTQLATTAFAIANGGSGNSNSRTVTKTVAPTGTPADYNTTGTNDDVVFQTAVNAVIAAGGGTVYARAGTYSLGHEILIVTSNFTFQAEQGAVFNLQNTLIEK